MKRDYKKLIYTIVSIVLAIVSLTCTSFVGSSIGGKGNGKDQEIGNIVEYCNLLSNIENITNVKLSSDEDYDDLHDALNLYKSFTLEVNTRSSAELRADFRYGSEQRNHSCIDKHMTVYIAEDKRYYKSVGTASIVMSLNEKNNYVYIYSDKNCLDFDFDIEIYRDNNNFMIKMNKLFISTNSIVSMVEEKKQKEQKDGSVIVADGAILNRWIDLKKIDSKYDLSKFVSVGIITQKELEEMSDEEKQEGFEKLQAEIIDTFLNGFDEVDLLNVDIMKTVSNYIVENESKLYDNDNNNFYVMESNLYKNLIYELCDMPTHELKTNKGELSIDLSNKSNPILSLDGYMDWDQDIDNGSSSGTIKGFSGDDLTWSFKNIGNTVIKKPNSKNVLGAMDFVNWMIKAQLDNDDN